MSAIHLDAANSLNGDDDAVNAFMEHMAIEPDAEGKKKKAPEEEPAVEEEEAPEAPEETEESEGSEETEGDEETEEEGGDEEKPKPRTVIEDDEAVFKVKVDGKDIEVAAKDLKRLYGQEAALTRKSQEAADLRKASEDVGRLHVAGLEGMLKRAEARLAPFQKLNFIAMAKDPTVSADELQWLHDEATKAQDDVAFLRSSLDNTVKAADDARRAQVHKAAAEAVKVLQDPEKGIPGFNAQVYADLGSYAQSQGIPASVFNDIVDPAALKLVHKAMLFDKGAKAANVQVTKVDKAPKRIVKSAPAQTTAKTKPSAQVKAMSRLSRERTQEAAEDAFLAMMSGS